MNPILLLGAGGAAAWALRQRFDNRIDRDLRALGSVPAKERASLDGLPRSARRIVERALPERAAPPRVVTLTQTGDFRHEPGSAWTSFEATQHIAVGHIGYLWRARLAALGVLRTDAVDSLVRSAGRLEARLLGVWPLPVARGPEVMRAQVFRYLAELPWAPHALYANPEVEWSETEDGLSIAAVGVNASVRVHLDDHGSIVRATGMRPRIERSKVTETPWSVSLGDYDVLEGVRIPRLIEARWDTDPAFVYLRIRVHGVQTI